MKLPLEKRLRKESHRQIGRLQDELMEIAYNVSPLFVLHGGTELWRCFGGGRFSEDIDLYLPEASADLDERLKEAITARGLAISKFKRTENLIYAKVSNPEAEVRLEINLAGRPFSAPLPYEKMDGSSMIVMALPLEKLILEKAAAYRSRKLIRDIYDVYFLSEKLEDGKTGEELRGFAKTCPSPVDEENLQTIVYSGAVPTFEQMHLALRRRLG